MHINLDEFKTVNLIAIEKLKGRGRSLFLAVNRSRYTNKEAAEKAGYKENTFYTHVKKENLSFSILAKYGTAIRYDFSIEYPEMDEIFPNSISNTANSQIENKEYIFLKDKYTKLLESHKELQDKYNELQVQFFELSSKKKTI